MSFVNPIWLWGLTALTIPAAIHLMSRKHSNVIRLGSLRHLDNSTTKQTLSLRLNELLLLAARSALIVLLVLLLSGLRFASHPANPVKWLLIERGLDNEPQFKSLVDSLRAQGFTMKRFARTFPPVEDSEPDSTMDYWKLIQDLQSRDVDEAVVLSWNKLQGFKGKRIAKPGNIRWITTSPEPSSFMMRAVSMGNDSVLVRKGQSSVEETSFQNDIILRSTVHPDRIESRDTITVTIVSDTKYDTEKRIMVAALQAIATNRWLTVVQKSSPSGQLSMSESDDWIIWLTDDPKPEKMPSNIVSLKLGAAGDANLLIPDCDCYPGHNCWMITQRLHVEAAFNEHLAIELFSILTNPYQDKLREELASMDKRVLPEKANWSTDQPTARIVETVQSKVDGFLCILILMLLLSERILAFKRNQ